ncbi:MAG: hypothetical protein J07HQW2_00249 [Haloquadratum walsbyi J07HQW2]|uniref:Uncharacterized protein n=1 Tax=Haloquadratum walsbyi J07HQW2 TaxID=1238425 RepID=U1NAG2_9EURY|nr:MAG: hypothetical protein J07HQW2_00249 [Haloquadratum walsbyi J07HQW2]
MFSDEPVNHIHSDSFVSYEVTVSEWLIEPLYLARGS